MSNTTAASRWSWRRWLERVESSPLPEADKAVCRHMRTLYGNGKPLKWVANWEVDHDGSGRYGPALARAQRHGLAYRKPGTGSYIATDAPPPPPPGSVRIGRASAALLVRVLEGKSLHVVLREGYFGERWKPGMAFLEWVDGIWQRRDSVEMRAIKPLVRRDILYRDGAGYGWPIQYSARLSVRQANLCLIAGLARYQTGDSFWLAVDQRAEVLAKLKAKGGAA